MTSKIPTLGEMNRRIAVTNWRETPDDDVNLIRTRPVIFQAWARINDRPPTAANRFQRMDNYQADGLAVPTHFIVIRNPSDVSITTKHWIYATRRNGRREWFRITGIQHIDPDECWLSINCVLDEIHDKRSDPAVLVQPLPAEVAGDPVLIDDPTHDVAGDAEHGTATDDDADETCLQPAPIVAPIDRSRPLPGPRYGVY